MSLNQLPPRVFYLIESEYENDKTYILSWAMRTLDHKTLVEFYWYANRYRVMMSTESLALLDQMAKMVAAIDPKASFYGPPQYIYNDDHVGQYDEEEGVEQTMSFYHPGVRYRGGNSPMAMNVQFPRVTQGPQAGPYYQQKPVKYKQGLGFVDLSSMDLSDIPGGSSGSSSSGSGWNWQQDLMKFLAQLGTQGIQLAAKIRAGDQQAALAAEKMKKEYELQMAKLKAAGTATTTNTNSALAALQAKLNAALGAKTTLSTGTMLGIGLVSLAAIMLLSGRKRNPSKRRKRRKKRRRY